ncbi:MAG: response regulator transcription factor [Lentisphaerota bacterium]
METLRIIVAEDDSSSRLMMKLGLTGKARKLQMDVEVLLAEDGQEAVDLALQGADAAILDISMPLMDGFEVVRRIREMAGWSDKPVIMLSANTHVGYKKLALEAGADELMVKPVGFEKLLNTINNRKGSGR